MIRDDREQAAATGAQAATAPAGIVPSALRRVAFFGSLFAVFYGLVLFVLNDDWFLLAIPGIIGMATLGALTASALLRSRLPQTVPYAMDGADRESAVQYYRSVLRKRYALLLALVAVVVALFVLTRSDYLIPLAPLAVFLFLFGSYELSDQMVTIGKCSGVLKTYPYTYRAPVRILNRSRGGKQVFRLGDGDEESSKLLGRQLGAETRWADSVADGVWFAGDELFGGVLLVPGSGEFVWAQPADEPALRYQRESLSPERKETAKRAGIGRTLK
ncbi:hypothetical protein [Streptomyces sp. NPDC127084]|uniref:hypothetical protein n=1 Tax=Streptomyces sp. NPDC127084 TaxID=3347133 RepID=UPI00364CFCB7